MTFFNDSPNSDFSHPADVSAGPKLGILGAFEAAYNEAWIHTSAFGAEMALQNEEMANIDRVRKVGGDPPLSIMDIGGVGYTKYLRAVGADIPDGADEGRAGFVADARANAVLGDRNNRLRELQTKFPDAGILTYDEMWNTVKAQDIAARRRAALHTTTMGGVASFFGGMAGNLNPRTNPLNFATLPLAAGRTAVGRILAQVGIQTGIEAIDQFTGARENMRLFGDNPSVSDSLLQIGEAGLFGGLVQGGGEVLGAAIRGGRRWFAPKADTPPPPKPEIAPAPVPDVLVKRGVDFVLDRIELGKTRVGRAGGAADLNYMGERLASWTDSPLRIMPALDEGLLNSTALPASITKPGVAPLPEMWQKSADALNTNIDSLARNVDPATFKVYDTLNEKRAAVRQVAGLPVDKEALARGAQKLQDAIEQKQRQFEKAKTPEAQATIQLALNELQKKQALTGTTIADELTRLDKKIETLQPAMERAYARAQGLWDVYEGQRQQIKDMIKAGSIRLPDGASNVGPAIGAGNNVSGRASPKEPTLIDHVPELQNVVAKPGETTVDTIARAVQQNTDMIDENVAQFQSSIAKILSDTNVDGTVHMEGYTEEIPLGSKVTITNLDGTGERTVTVRQMLEDVQEDADTLGAVGSCSTVKTS